MIAFRWRSKQNVTPKLNLKQQVDGARISVTVTKRAIVSLRWAEDDRRESHSCLVTACRDLLHKLLQIPRTKDSKWLRTRQEAPPTRHVAQAACKSGNNNLCLQIKAAHMRPPLITV